MVFRDQYMAKMIDPDIKHNTITHTEITYTETITSAKVNLSAMTNFKHLFGTFMQKLN